MHYNQKIGEFGEMLAKSYLVKEGYTIIGTNVKTGYKEIDIIANFNNILIFIEVKTRTSTTFGQADQAISRKKINNFKKAIELYIYRKNYNPNCVRADLIAIDINRSKETAKIKHYKEII